jgi:hypothetical protein
MGVTARGAEQGPRPQGGDATAGVRWVSARAVSRIASKEVRHGH